MEEKRRRGQQNDTSAIQKEKQTKKIKKSSVLYFIPFVVIVFSGLSFKALIPFADTVVSLILTAIFVISFLCSYVGAFKTGKIKKGFTSIINILLMLIFIGLSVVTVQINAGLGQITSNDVNAKKVNVKSQAFNVLISGTDTRGDEIDNPSRSDVIMVATINPKENKVLFTSLPRDTYYPLTCTGVNDKLTHASAQSMECLQSTVESILDIKINYYIKANFYSVINLIDAVGGVDIEVTDSFCGQDENDTLNAYCFNPGQTHMSGSEALSYARERKSFSDGDYARAAHQQQVMNAFILKVIANPGSFNNLISISADSVRTNMSSSELLNLLDSFTNFTSEGYVVSGSGMMVDIPTQGLYGTSVQVLNDASLVEAKNKINEYLQ